MQGRRGGASPGKLPETSVYAGAMQLRGKKMEEKKDGKITERSQYVVENKGSALKNEPKTNPI
jgi:hypothetical protein